MIDLPGEGDGQSAVFQKTGKAHIVSSFADYALSIKTPVYDLLSQTGVKKEMRCKHKVCTARHYR
jgi:hypothetical protein